MMANISNGSQYTLVSGTTDNDYIKNTGAYASVYGYGGSDTIYNTDISHWSVIDAGAGNDSIYSEQGNYLTIRGSTGDDTIRIKSLYSNSHVIQYSEGDGNDYIEDTWGSPNCTLQIGGGTGTYSTQMSGSNKIVTVGDGKITLVGAMSSISIQGIAVAPLNPSDITAITIREGYNYPFENSLANITINGSAGNDTIKNEAEKVTINAGAGNDSIYNYGTEAVIFGGDGADTIYATYTYQSSSYKGWHPTIYGGSGNDSIQSYCAHFAYIYADDGNDYISVNEANGSTVYGGDGSDTIWNYSNASSLFGGSGSDSIINAYGGTKAFIKGDSGADTIENYSATVTIDGGAGNDWIQNSGVYDRGNNVTINGGAGNDTIDNSGSNVLFTYTAGDGNDKIVGFNDTSTLQIGGGTGTYSSQTSGSNIVVTVGDGKVTLVGVTSANIKGTKVSTETNSWKLNGTTATYGTSSKTLVIVSGVKETSGISLSGKVVTVAASSLNQSKVTVSDGYTLALASDVTKPSTNKAWSLSGSTATYKQTTAAGYKLASDAKSISYTKKATSTLTTLMGVKSTSGLSVSGKVVTVSKAALGTSKVTVSGDYTLKLASDVTKTSTKKAWSLSGTTATYKQTTSAGYKLASDSKSISYTKKATSTLATLTGVKSTSGLSVSGKVITVSKAALNASKVTVSDGYTLELASGVTKTSTKKAWSYSNSVATYKQTTAAGYKLASDAKSISYTKKATSTLATVNGAKSKNGFTVNGKTIKLATSSLSSKVSVSGSYAFEFASDYKSAKISGSGSNDSITTAGQKITIASGAGNDYIVSKGKTSTMNAGAGNDTIVNSGADVTIRGGKGNDNLTGGSGKDTFVYASGDGNDVITNYDTSDRISIESGTAKVSTSGDNVIFTVGSGKITVKGGKGKTITYFESGNELVYPEKKSSDVVYNEDGTAAKLKITYSKKKFEPSDYSSYSGVLVTIDASAVKHTLNITGNDQANEITGTNEDDTIKGGEAGDIIFGGGGNDELYGEIGNDSLSGGAGDDSLLGGAGSDTLNGGSGDDSLWGGAGNDTLYGGDGDDTFIYNNGDGKDIIADFGKGDIVMILSGKVGGYSTNKSDVTFKVGTGQIVFQNAVNKHIELVDKEGNLLKEYIPNN